MAGGRRYAITGIFEVGYGRVYVENSRDAIAGTPDRASELGSAAGTPRSSADDETGTAWDRDSSEEPGQGWGNNDERDDADDRERGWGEPERPGDRENVDDSRFDR